jgi:hypothetical protein
LLEEVVRFSGSGIEMNQNQVHAHRRPVHTHEDHTARPPRP